MKLRPTIFLSGVSIEFGSFRDAVEVEVQKKDCFALAAAEKLINECGYHRRDEELADAKRVILGRSA
jgi:hypothetical protein